MRVASSCKYGGLFDNDYLSVVGLGKWDRIISNSAMQAPFLFLKIILKSWPNGLKSLIMLDLLRFTAVYRSKPQYTAVNRSASRCIIKWNVIGDFCITFGIDL